MIEAYRGELNGVVALPDNEPNVYEMGRKIRVHIEEELAKPLPNNSLIALLCDAARLGDGYIRRIEGESVADQALSERQLDEVSRLRSEVERLAGWLTRIEGGERPCTDESQLREWAYEAVTLGREPANA